ncbi:hypothetical protein PV11_05055 [Exophiala sideris]|uniref:C3H1-type domain-containing protein n=1 Tax=Exophiala sideris TaxID=1016849 RepID=A0A0D1Z8D5_9EURO|nr:hypothetical protein PV11_05055 [Exophiala sideris]
MANQNPLKPQYFITRQNGALVPLIAIDELPANVQVRGVPRSLTPFAIAGMTSLGLCESQHQFYVVEGVNNTKPDHISGALPSQNGRCQASKPVVSLPISQAASPFVLPAMSPFPAQRPGDSSSNSTISFDQSVVTATRTSANPSASTSPEPAAIPAWRKDATPEEVKPPTSVPVTGQKVYCSYWLRKGECDFAQQGCIYKHEMPTDLATLLTVGFTDIPLWYRQRHGLGSLHVENGQSKPSFGIVDPNATARGFRDGDDAKRMIRNQLGPSNRARGLGGFNKHNGRDAKKAEVERENEKKREEEKMAAALKLDLEEEKERKALMEKYKSLKPERRSVLVGHEDLASDTFSNGEEPNDLMAQIRRKEQAGWEEEQAERLVAASAETSTNKDANSKDSRNKGKTGAKRGRGGQGRKK